MDGLLGVAGMMKLIVSQWIISKNSLRLAPVSQIGRFSREKGLILFFVDEETCEHDFWK